MDTYASKFLTCNKRCNQIILVKVTIPADLSYTKQVRTDEKPIDKCLADIVNALQKSGIFMRSSCCGHGKGKGHGEILLEDGRILQIHRRAE